MGTYITHDSVRRTLGVSTDLISDVDIDAFIIEIEALVPRFFNTVFTMTESIDIKDGDGSDRVMLLKNPVWTVRELVSDTVTELPSNLYVYREGGRVTLSNSSIVSRFPNKKNIVRIRYLYGKLDYTTTTTHLSTATAVGTNVVMTVASESGFTTGDWIDIKGTDGNYEATHITGTGSGTITVDQLVYTHSTNSLITKLGTSPIFTRIMNVICAIAVVNRVLGGSYNTESAYSLGELSVTLQEPNVFWKETLNQFVQERDRLMSYIKIRPYVGGN